MIRFLTYLILLFSCTTLLAQSHTRIVGNKSYELSNHLGNVLEGTTDRKVHQNAEAEIAAFNDYYPYGMLMEMRNGTLSGAEGYRYAFQGQEKDDGIKSVSNSYTTELRDYDNRLGRWLSQDPEYSKQPGKSPYKSYNNNPIFWIDNHGNTEYETIIINDERTGEKLMVEKAISNEIVAKRVEVSTMGDDYSIEYDWHDVHNVTEYNINSNGEVTISEKIVLGKKRAHTWFMTKWAAKLIAYGWEGDGGSQNGGYTLTTKSGGASPTKQKSLNPAEEIDITVLLDVLGNISGGSLGNTVPDAIKDISGMIGSGTDIYHEFNTAAIEEKEDELKDMVLSNDQVENFHIDGLGSYHFHLGDRYYNVVINDTNGDYSVYKGRNSGTRDGNATGVETSIKNISNEQFKKDIK